MVSDDGCLTFDDGLLVFNDDLFVSDNEFLVSDDALVAPGRTRGLLAWGSYTSTSSWSGNALPNHYHEK